MKPARLAPAPRARLGAALLLAALLAADLRAASPESEEFTEESGGVETGETGGIPAAPDAHGAPDAPAPAAVSPPDPAPPAEAAPAGPAPVLPHPSRAATPSVGSGPVLHLLPTAGGKGLASASPERDVVSEALRLAARQAGRHRVQAAEETARPFGRLSAVPAGCFSEACVARAARRLGSGLLLVSELSRPGAGPGAGAAAPARLALALVEAPSGRVRRAVEARACPESAGPIPFAQQAAWYLLLGAAAPEAAAADAAPGDGGGPGCVHLASLRADSGAWRDIPWLNPKDTVDHRGRWALAGSGVLLAGFGLAWAQGQLLQEDRNPESPSGPLLPRAGESSWLRGFFAVPNLGAQYAALGGAGIAHARNAQAVLLNPAGVALARRENVVAAKRNLPGGSPSLLLAYAGPLKGGLYQGLGVQHEGDDLASETALQATLAGDGGAFLRGLAGLRAGATLKGYLARVGEGGTGLDRSTGHSLGLGLDLGLGFRLTDRIEAAVAVRDAFGFLRHRNTFTDESYGEILPPEWRVGAAYQVDPATLLLLDGQKALFADQVDHVRLGGERVLFGFLAARAGLHQAFGRESVRILSVGFGLDTDGLSDLPLGARVALHYAFDFGLDADEPLGGGQQFSLDVSW